MIIHKSKRMSLRARISVERDEISMALKQIVLYSDSAMLELFMSGAALGWGGWLLLPPATFAITPLYDTFTLVAPEHIWGICFALWGGISCLIVLVGSESIRRLTILLSAGLWGWVATRFAIASFWALATYFHAFLALTCIWIRVRIFLR